MISKREFGRLASGEVVDLYTLSNQNGQHVDVITLGATIQSWVLETGTDIVLGFDSLQAYLDDPFYLGATVGRYANRIAHGRFVLNEQTHQVSVNLGEHSLHGGEDGFHNRIWQAKVIREDQDPAIELSLTSADGDQGFPGTLQVTLTLTLTESNALRLEYRGISDRDTLFNPTQHSYFNLTGHQSGSALNHAIAVAASHYTPADLDSIPTGEIRPVDGSAFDLRTRQVLSDVLAKSEPQMVQTSGLDHNWCLDGYQPSSLEPFVAAKAWDPEGTLEMTVTTTMPGMQVYTGNFLGSDMLGKGQQPYGPHHGFCFETQFYPDSPNQTSFPSPILRAGQPFQAITEYQIKKMPS